MLQEEDKKAPVDLGARIREARRSKDWKKYSRLIAKALRGGIPIPVTWLRGWPEKY